MTLASVIDTSVNSSTRDQSPMDHRRNKCCMYPSYPRFCPSSCVPKLKLPLPTKIIVYDHQIKVVNRSQTQWQCIANISITFFMVFGKKQKMENKDHEMFGHLLDGRRMFVNMAITNLLQSLQRTYFTFTLWYVR